jgi:AcrR family transcriptional regulator
MAGDEQAGLGGFLDWPEEGLLERRLLDAVLACVGERGYRETTLGMVIRRSNSSTSAFERHFESLETCFAKAYGLAAEELCVELIAIGRAAGDWRKGLRAGLTRFAEFVEERPELARVIMLEYRFGGEMAIAKHEELVERISVELDRARDEATGERPPSFGQTAIGAIEFMTRRAIYDGGGALGGLVEELGHFVTMLYLGVEAAEEEFGPAG